MVRLVRDVMGAGVRYEEIDPQHETLRAMIDLLKVAHGLGEEDGRGLYGGSGGPVLQTRRTPVSGGTLQIRLRMACLEGVGGRVWRGGKTPAPPDTPAYGVSEGHAMEGGFRAQIEIAVWRVGARVLSVRLVDLSWLCGQGHVTAPLSDGRSWEVRTPRSLGLKSKYANNFGICMLPVNHAVVLQVNQRHW